ERLSFYDVRGSAVPRSVLSAIALLAQDKDTIKEYSKSNFDVEMEDVHLSYKGWNWGECGIENGLLTFKVEDKLASDIPLADITQAAAQGPQGKEKNEAVIEMAVDDTAMPEDEILVEMRVPRGRYEIEMFDKYMKLHGKTYDYKILYSNVSALFLLPKPDGVHMSLCITLEHALRQGQTTYPYVVMQLPREQFLDVSINLGEQELTQRFGDKLDQSEQGDMPSVLAKVPSIPVFSAFTKKKVATLRKDGFNGGSKAEDDRATSVRCSVKANEGHLYPLDKVFFFISNKPLLIEFEKVGSVEFNRVSNQQSSARTFDLTVHMKDASSHQFVNLQRSVYKLGFHPYVELRDASCLSQELYRFLNDKKIRIKNVRADTFADDDGEGADDGDMDDLYMNQLQQERELGDDDDDDEDEEDEDFAPGAESDIDEEYDEGELDDDGQRISKKRSNQSDGDDDGDDDDDEVEETKPVPKKTKKEEPTKKPKAQPAALAGAQWKELDAEARAPYEEMAREDKERQKREMSAYKAAQRVAAAGSDVDGDDDVDTNDDD
ncbi:MAG: hypothetical protein SGPRY_003999, partial [Prymnesium sp.]